jgi:hypothetical protein
MDISRILKNSIIIRKIDKFLFLLEKYILSEYIENRQKHEKLLYYKLTEILNYLFERDKDQFNEKLLKTFIDYLTIDNQLNDFIESNYLIENTWIYKKYYYEIKEIKNKILKEILKYLENNEIFTYQEFINILKLKDQFEIKEKIKEYKEELKKVKPKKRYKQRDLKKLKSKIEKLEIF